MNVTKQSTRLNSIALWPVTPSIAMVPFRSTILDGLLVADSFSLLVALSLLSQIKTRCQLNWKSFLQKDVSFNAFRYKSADKTRFAFLEPPSRYWVLSTDYANYAVVWACSDLTGGRSREQVWVLSRTPQLGATQRTRVNDVVAENSLLPDLLRPTSQNLEACQSPIPF